MIIQTNTYSFQKCKEKLEMYIKTGKTLMSTVWQDLICCKNGNDIQFYTGCDLIYEFSFGSYEDNIEQAVIWLLSGQKDPLKK